MPATVQQRYTLIADGRRTYTFTPLSGGVKVAVRFTSPRYSTEAIAPTQEARELWRWLLRSGYERW